MITLGKFDGLHRGHELLMRTVQAESKAHNLKSIVFTFNIPPRNQVDGTSSRVLTTNAEKHMVFEREGIDYLIECPFTPEVMKMAPEDFIAWIVNRLHVKVIVVGKDFRFGYRRGGDYKLLIQCEERYGYRTIVKEKMQEDGRDISSSYVRERIAMGDIEKANRLLGYPYFICSKVIHGNRIGRTIGIPTINMALDPCKQVPLLGVYVSRVTINGKTYMGVSNIGRKPTISGDNPIGIETYIIGFEGDVYDEILTVELLSFVRPEMKFASIPALQRQMEKDIRTAVNFAQKMKNNS